MLLFNAPQFSAWRNKINKNNVDWFKASIEDNVSCELEFTQRLTARVVLYYIVLY